ncbi:MAG: excinuclease ABC subunit UvrB [Calditrichia bacterium]|nr:excinuclease ABC subunit UvrB [Calditrichia bacterium]
MKDKFELDNKFRPTGDQPSAIKRLTDGVLENKEFQTLLGVTGSGKTFTMANVIANINKPTLILSHNKTLAAQLYGEFKQFFPNNAVEFFISYYDYYQPEAYVPQSDTYIEKDSSINDDIDRLRLKATSSLLARKDVIVVASVSCIFGLGSPEDYKSMLILLKKGQAIDRTNFLHELINVQYERNDFDFKRGVFRIRGDVIEIYPAYEKFAYRIDTFGDEIETIYEVDPITGEIISERENIVIYPAKHFVTTQDKLRSSIDSIELELKEQLEVLKAQNKLVEAQRLEQRTHYDIEMMLEMGYCNGIENYSRHLSQRKPGQRPFVLLDFFPDDFLCFIDESHQSIPQTRAMYAGDHSRKSTLVEYGFRLPSALDNRPLKFDEFIGMMNKMIFVSATPGDWEIEKSSGEVVDQVIRPTGLLDPEIEVRPTKNQIDDLLSEIHKQIEKKKRVLVLTLTKRMAEDLTDYLLDADIKVRYIHSEVNTLDRVDILRELRLAQFDVLVGINLLREGLDLPEVSLVAILDADKEGFLRSEVSLLQIAGRAARNVEGRVIFYADRITRSMDVTMNETARRREKQKTYNEKHSIAPRTIYKSKEEILKTTAVADIRGQYEAKKKKTTPNVINLSDGSPVEMIRDLEIQMQKAAEELEFEKAAYLRDKLIQLKEQFKIKN